MSTRKNEQKNETRTEWKLRLRDMQVSAGTKISEISANFSSKFRFSVLVEKKFRWKNRLKKNRGKIAKNRRFFPKFGVNYSLGH